MANIQTITKAGLTLEALRRLTGADPDLDIQADYVRVYYTPDELRKAQAWFKKSMESEPGKVRMEIAPVVTPYFIKKYIPYAIGAAALMYFMGKMT